MIRTQQLVKQYSLGHQKVNALNSVSISIERGQFVSIMGPSGSGKSSLLQIIGGLDRPTSGSVEFENESIHALSDYQLSLFRRRKLGFIFQFFNLIPSMTSVENVALPLLLDGFSFRDVEKKAVELLDMMGLKSRARHRPSEMSGGELQRVAIARALVTEPILILADEPTGNLDSKSGALVLELLAQLVRDRKQTLLMVTHDRKAADYGSRLISLRDGSVEKDELLVKGKIQ